MLSIPNHLVIALAGLKGKELIEYRGGLRIQSGSLYPLFVLAVATGPETVFGDIPEEQFDFRGTLEWSHDLVGNSQ